MQCVIQTPVRTCVAGDPRDVLVTGLPRGGARGEMREIGRRLLDTDGAYWHFYSRDSVEELIP